MFRNCFTLMVLMASLAACQRNATPERKTGSATTETSALASSGSSSSDGASAKSEQPLLVATEDLITVHNGALASGTVITGSIQPERRADLRAEVSAIILQVLKENGESVKRGDLLVRLDDTSIRDSVNSAEEATRAAVQTFDQAERQYQRLKTLRASGMVSTQQMEDAEIHRNNAQSDVVAAKARAVQARQQLQRTEVRAPFDGIVSERKASVGDSAQIGKELVKVIDPASVRFEGFVSADKINTIKIGQPVSFRVNGYGPRDFAGKVKRIDAAADPTTRQVSVLVSLSEDAQPGVSGLYAEGKVETSTTNALVVPESALVREGDHVYAWRVQNGIVNRVGITIGARDVRRGDYEVKSGLSDGDKVLRNPQSNLKDGARVEPLANPAAAAKSKEV